MGHVDFVLPLDVGAVLVVGWEEVEDRVGLCARVGGAALTAAWRAPHVRRDLDPSRALGWLTLFRPAAEDLELTLGGVSKPMGPADLTAYAERFAGEVVDEALHACLWAMAREEIPCFGPGWQHHLAPRLAAARHPCVEGEGAAVGIVSAMWSEALGWGYAQGWSLSSGDKGDMGALRLGTAGARSLTIQPCPELDMAVEEGVLRRFEGRSVEPWSLSLSDPPLGNDELLILRRGSDGVDLMALHPLAKATSDTVAAGALALSIQDAVCLPEIDLSPVCLSRSPETCQGPVHVELYHDAGPTALRDTIRCLSRGIKAPFSLSISGPTDLARAVKAAGPDLAAAHAVVTANPPDSAVVLAAQSSAILQLAVWEGALARLREESLAAIAVVHAPHVPLLGPKGAAVLERALSEAGTGIVAVFAAAAWKICLGAGPPAASSEGALRQKLIALRSGGAALALIPDQSNAVAPPLTANAAWHFDLARLECCA